jgi:ABC-type branched-subunit amino acid transport system substrate-binding protein
MHGNSIDRRAFIGRAAAITATALVPLNARRAHAGPAVSLSVGVVLPAGHPALAGVRLGASEAEHAARLFGSRFTQHEAAASGADAARGAARRLISEHAIDVLIGGATAADADALADAAVSRAVLFMNIGVPADTLSRRCDPHVFHLMPSNAVLQAALQSAPATPGARVALWHPRLSRFGAGQVNDRFEDAFGQPMTGAAWAGWMAVKVAFDAAQRAQTADARRLGAHLTAARTVFDGHKGVRLSFQPGTHELQQPLYVVAGDEIVAEVASPSAEVEPCTS